MSQSQSHPPILSSPEATFMDQVYIAILDVAENVMRHMKQEDPCSATLSKFFNGTRPLAKLEERCGGILLASGVSIWDEVERMRGQVKDLLCCIGDIFVNGKPPNSLCMNSTDWSCAGFAKCVTKTELGRQSLVGPTLPALLASDRASDVLQSPFYRAYDTAEMDVLVDRVGFMVTEIEQLAETFYDIPRCSSGGSMAARDSCSDPCRRPW